MKKQLLKAVSFASLLLLTACNNTATMIDDTGMDSSAATSAAATSAAVSSDAASSEESSMMEEDASSSNAMSDAAMSEDAVDATDARVIPITVSDWNFAPAAITATKGEKVVVRLTGTEGAHSFTIKELGIHVTINPGETKDVVIPTDVAGTFAFLCRVPCGAGHMDMNGVLTIS